MNQFNYCVLFWPSSFLPPGCEWRLERQEMISFSQKQYRNMIVFCCSNVQALFSPSLAQGNKLWTRTTEQLRKASKKQTRWSGSCEESLRDMDLFSLEEGKLWDTLYDQVEPWESQSESIVGPAVSRRLDWRPPEVLSSLNDSGIPGNNFNCQPVV